MPDTLVCRNSNDDTKIAYWDQGFRNEDAVLCLHGNLGTKRWWEPLFEVMPPEVRLVALDFPGCGETARRAIECSVPALTQFLAGFVQDLKLSGFTILAHSTSCAVALEFSLHFPHLVNSLVLCGCPPLSGVKSPPELYRHLQAARVDPSLMSNVVHYLMPNIDLSVQSLRDWFAILVQDACKIDRRSMDGMTRSLETWSIHDRITNLQVPLLIMRGQDDEIVTHETALITLRSTTLANNLEVIRGAGHSPMIENPEAFAIRLIDFIAQDEPSIDIPPV